MSAEVKLKRKVQLRKKQETEQPASRSNGRKWWILVLLGVLAVVGYFVFSTDTKESDVMASVSEEKTESVGLIEEVSAPLATENESVSAEEVVSTETEPVSETETETSPVTTQTQPIVQSTKQNLNVRSQSTNHKTKADNTSASNNGSKTLPVSSDTDDIEREAMDVIRGVYGNGADRKEKLGSRYQAIQNRVNQLKKEGLF